MPLQVVPRRDRKLNSLIKKATPRAYRKGVVIYRQGEPSVSVLLVQVGHVRLTLPKTGADCGRIVAPGAAGPGLSHSTSRGAQKGGYRGFQKAQKEGGHPLTLI
jgi:hypothetical protein